MADFTNIAIERKEKDLMPKRRILIGSIIILVCMSVLFAYAYHETENEATDMVAPVQEAILFPSVDSLDADCVTSDVREAMTKIFGKDFSDSEVYGSWDAENLDRDVVDVAFMGQNSQNPYIASIDPETKKIFAIETVAEKGDQLADAGRQEDYVRVARDFLLDQLSVSETGTWVCRLPSPNGNVMDRSVYVFFPELFLYVEISASSDLHLVGYRHFSDAEEMNVFMETQSQTF